MEHYSRDSKGRSNYKSSATKKHESMLFLSFQKGKAATQPTNYVFHPTRLMYSSFGRVIFATQQLCLSLIQSKCCIASNGPGRPITGMCSASVCHSFGVFSVYLCATGFAKYNSMISIHKYACVGLVPAPFSCEA